MGWIFDDNRPIYLQIMEEIKKMIIAGKIKPGEQVPAVRDLAKNAGVNPNTMQRALAGLEQIGIIYTDRTQGRFVKKDSELIAEFRRNWVEDLKQELGSKIREANLTKEEFEYVVTALRRSNAE